MNIALNNSKHLIRPLGALVLTIGCVLAGVGVLSGCQTTTQTQGSTGIVTRFNGTTLKADLPLSVSVAKAVEASRKVLEARYFVIVDSRVGADSGFVTARPPRTTDFPRVRIVAENAVTAEGSPVTRLNITYQPVGDEFSSRDVMGRILTELGL
ncbi:MAG: hypothetical protein SFY96_03595 [Planctomycetota bacterium]|nr:hypothetical protein [Planctomycetota bacterium]